MLDSVISYGVVYAGLNTSQERFDDLYADGTKKFRLKTLPGNSDHAGRSVLVGAIVCDVTILSWEKTLEQYRAVHNFCGTQCIGASDEGQLGMACARLALVEAQLATRNADFDYRSQRTAMNSGFWPPSFRLSAENRLIGSVGRRYSADRAALCDGRILKMPKRTKFRGSSNPLTRWHIDRITKNLESWDFLRASGSRPAAGKIRLQH